MEVKIECRQQQGQEMPEWVELALKAISMAAGECEAEADWKSMAAAVAVAGMANSMGKAGLMPGLCLDIAKELSSKEHGVTNVFAELAKLSIEVVTSSWSLKSMLEGLPVADCHELAVRDLEEIVNGVAGPDGQNVNVVNVKDVLVRCLRRAADVADGVEVAGEGYEKI